MSRISVHGLIKRYGDATAVDGIDIDIAEGEFLVLLGPSGCGKTTTLRCIAGLEEIDGGRISIGDEIVSTAGHSVPPEDRQIGMVFQSYAVWPHLSVFDNVAFALKLKRVATATIKRRVEATLDLVGLGGFASRGAHQLSGGQLQRVALARAVVAAPRVLLFDEPLSNLDAALRERMRFELRNLQQQLGITSVYVTHDQQEAMAVADRIALLNGGRIVQIGPPLALYESPSSLFAARFIGNANVIPGTVGMVGGATQVRLQGGIEMLSTRTGFPAGTEVDVAVRPEQIRLSAEKPEGPNCFPVTIRNTVFLGNLSDLTVSLGELQLRAQHSPPVPWGPDMPIWMQVPPESVILLAASANGREASGASL